MKTAQRRAIGLLSMFLVVCFAASTQGLSLQCQGGTYTVKAGDTLSELANKALEIEAKCSVQKIAEANRIDNVNRITIGERLCLPKGCAQPK